MELSVGGIGGVASLPEFRGQGLASKLVERCVEDLRQQGAALAFLWSDQHDFYRNLGFELVGRQWMVVLPKEKVALLREEAERLRLEHRQNSNKFSFSTNASIAAQAGKSLYDLHSLRIERSAVDFAKLISSKGAKVFTAELNGKLEAYFIVGKGIDLKNHVHEWAGSEEAMLSLLAFALDTIGNDLTFLSPQFTSEEAPILYRLEKMGFAATPGFMALTRILDFAKVKNFVLGKMRNLAMEPSLIRFEKTGSDEYCIGWTTDPDLYMNGRELSRFVFGPDLPSSLVPVLPDNSRVAFDALFPCRLWWWGMDSI
jgi:hypothetical protein